MFLIERMMEKAMDSITQLKDTKDIQRRNKEHDMSWRDDAEKGVTECENHIEVSSDNGKNRWSPVLKSGVVILIFWNMVISVVFTSYKHVPALNNYFITYGLYAVLLLFSPLAVYLADTRWGRRNTVMNSLCFMFWSVLMITVFNCLVAIGFIPIFTNPEYAWNSRNTIATILLGLAFMPPCILGIVLIILSLVAYSANVIQFGWDQLCTLPKENAMLYLHWFFWSSFFGQFITKLLYGNLTNLISILYVLVCTVPGFLVTFSVTLLCCGCKYKSRLFQVDELRNPYRMIYKIIKFAKHGNHSGTEYETLHSKLDVGKEEFGGPFCNDKVEDVKRFLTISYILLTLGPSFAIEIANEQLFKFGYHIDPSNAYSVFLISAVTPAVVLVLIPAYTCLVRPFVKYRTPGPLTCIVLGMLLFLMSIVICLVIDTLGHVLTQSPTCFLSHDFTLPGINRRDYLYYCLDYNNNITKYAEDNGTTTETPLPYCFVPLNIPLTTLFIPYIINGVAYMLLYIGTFEFIWTQSPPTMKGLIIGVFFAIKGGFQLFALLLYAPFTAWSSHTAHHFPSCGSVYWLINAVVTFIGIIAFVWRARLYRN